MYFKKNRPAVVLVRKGHARIFTNSSKMADKTQEELGKKLLTLHLIFSLNNPSIAYLLYAINKTFILLSYCIPDLLERLFLRLGAAQTDDQLEKTVGTFLTPLLLKVSSNNENVKKKVRI